MSDMLKVLIVDDSAITRGLFEKAFVRNDFEIAASVSNGRKAVDFCRDHEVDIVVSDYSMPEMNGIDTLRRIKEDFPEKYARTPIVALTANGDETSETSYKEAGFTAYLSKPIEEMKLNEILNKYIP